jgi:progesterone-induced-blocking factor 1
MGKHKERLEKLLGELNKSGAALDEPLPDLDLGSDDDDVSSFSDDDDSDLDLDKLDRLASGGGSDSKLDAKVAARTAKLQERLAQLVEEVRRKDERAEERLRMKDAEFDRERGRMMDAVKLLKDKQAELERLAPPLREAIVSAKDELAVLTCSTERMQELTRRRQDDLSLPEFAMLRVHQETADLRQNLDVCRLERDALKDANARLDVDNKRMQRDLKRVTSSVDADARESSADREALSRRCDRLGRDLEDALVKVEVLSAKGAMYDEVAATVDRLTKRAAEAEKEAVGAVSETKILRQEKHTLVSQMESRRHQCELLTQDKAYLSREVDAARERERKWEEEEDRLREKARGLRTHRDELLEKLATGQAELTDKHEQRLVAEIERLQTKAGEDLSRLREEHTSARDREIRALRDLRDAAVADAHVARRDLVDLRKGYDDLLTSHRQSQKNADVSHAELSGQLRMKSMELERVSMLHGEASSVAKVLRIECETLTKKCRLLESQYLQLESNSNRTRTESDMSIAEMAARLSHYEGLERELDEAVLRQAAGKENVGSDSIGGAGSDSIGGAGSGSIGPGSVNSSIDGLNALSGAVPASLRRRLQQSVALGRRVNELERTLAATEASRDAAVAKCDELESEVRRAKSRAVDASQPYNYLVDRIADVEKDADASARREREMGTKLEAARAAAHAAREEADALRKDLKAALDERSELAAIKNMLKGAAGRKALATK